MSEHKMDSEIIWDILKGWALLNWLGLTQRLRSLLDNTQNLVISESPKVFQNPL